MKRKIVKQGQATMTISLPSKWVKKNGLSSGDEVDLDEDGNSLTINTNKKEIFKVYSFDASLKKVMANRTIMQAYNQGYDEIRITYQDPSVIGKIKETVNELIGFEIIQESNKSCTLKELTGINQLEFDSIFRRLFRILKGIFEESIDAIKNQNKLEIDNLISRDLDINKFSNLCIRYLNKIGHSISERTGTYLVVCNTLERIGDQYKELLKYVRGKKLNQTYLQLIKKVNELLIISYKYSFELKDGLAVQVAQKYEELKKELEMRVYSDALLMSQIKSLMNSIINLNDLQIVFSE